VDRFFASGLSPGSITSLQIASRISFIPIFIFATASSVAIFPFLSRHIAQGRIDELKDTLIFGIKVSLLIAIPSMIGLMVLNKPIIQMLFERGSFTPQDTEITATMLFYYALGLSAQALIPLLFKTLYALQYTKIILKYETIYFVMNIILDYLLIKIMGAPGIALATSIIVPFVVIYLLRKLRQKKIDIDLRLLFPFLKKVTLASILMGCICYIVSKYLVNTLDLSLFLNRVYLVFGSIMAGLIAYLSFLLLLRTQEMQRLVQVLSKK
jgi:putative peptidoglycan lipid II flippase